MSLGQLADYLGKAHPDWRISCEESQIKAVREGRVIALDYVPNLNGSYVDADCEQCDMPSERPWHVDGRFFANKAHAFAALEDMLGISASLIQRPNTGMP